MQILAALERFTDADLINELGRRDRLQKLECRQTISRMDLQYAKHRERMIQIAEQYAAAHLLEGIRERGLIKVSPDPHSIGPAISDWDHVDFAASLTILTPKSGDQR